jgi:hypothetical protein
MRRFPEKHWSNQSVYITIIFEIMASCVADGNFWIPVSFFGRPAGKGMEDLCTGIE